MRTRTGWTAALLLVLVGVAGCGDGATSGEPSLRLPTSDVRIDVDEPAWMVGETLHVGDREVATGVAAESFTLVEGGALLLRGNGLWFTDTRGPAEEVADLGASGSETASASPDGRYVGFLTTSAQDDGHGDGLAEVVVVDVRTGAPVVRTSAGMGDPDEAVTEQYEDAAPTFDAIDARAAYATGPGDQTWSYPLDGSEPRRVDTPDLPVRGGRAATVEREDGRWAVVEEGMVEAVLSPDGRHGLADTLNVAWKPFAVASGRTLDLRAGDAVNRFALGAWLDDDRFWGFGFRGAYADVDGTGRILTCSIDERRCTPVSGAVTSTVEQPLVLPTR